LWLHDFVSHFISTDENLTHIARPEFFQSLTDSRVRQQAGWRSHQRLHWPRSRWPIHQNQELMQPCQVGCVDAPMGAALIWHSAINRAMAVPAFTVFYMGDEREGFYRVTTRKGEGWVDILLLKKP
jgi:hypothetical protein